MKYIKKMLIGTMTTAAIFVSTGCRDRIKFDLDKCRDISKQYLEQKYREKFEIVDCYEVRGVYKPAGYVKTLFKKENSTENKNYYVTIYPNQKKDKNNDGYYDSYKVTGDNYMRKIIKKLVKERMDGLIEKCGIKEFMNYATVIQRVHIVDTDFSTDFKYYTEENFELSDMFHNYEMCVGLYIRVKEECSETFQSSLSSELKPLLDDDIIDVTIEKMEDEDYEKYANNEEYDTNNSEYIEFSIRGDKYSE